MGLMSHTEVKEIADKSILDVPVQLVDSARDQGHFCRSTTATAYAIAHLRAQIT
jgi:hypothetical protein